MRECFVFQDVEEYFAYLGFQHATQHGDNRAELENAVHRINDLYVDIFLLAYEIEVYTNVMYKTVPANRIAKVIKWDDLMGYGTVSTIDGLIHFSYHDLDCDTLEIGSIVQIIYDREMKVPIKIVLKKI